MFNKNIKRVAEDILATCKKNDFNFNKMIFERELLGDTPYFSIIRMNFFYAISLDKDLALTDDCFVRNVIETFLNALIKHNFENEDKIIDFFNHDIYIEDYPVSFEKWIIANPERVKYIKRACENTSLEGYESDQLPRCSYDEEIVDICANLFDRIKDVLKNVEKLDNF